MTQPPRRLDQIRQRIRAKHYSFRTDKTCVHWIHRFTLFHDTRHPRELRAAEIEQFRTSLEVERKVSASTQNPALSAILPARGSKARDAGEAADPAPAA